MTAGSGGEEDSEGRREEGGGGFGPGCVDGLRPHSDLGARSRRGKGDDEEDERN